MRRAAPALAALSLVASAHADPIVVRHERPRFTVTVPDRFARVDPDGAARDLLDVFRRPGELPDEPPMVLQVIHLDAIVPQRPLTDDERAALRRADAFRFVDHVEHDRVLGFPVETLVGVSPLLGGASVTRFATAVPLDDDAVLLVLTAPSHRARDAHALLRETLASVRGPTTWETPARRRFNVAMRALLLATLLATVAFALVALVRRRRARRRVSPWPPAALAALWGAVAAWLSVPWREHEMPFAAVALLAATLFSLQTWMAARSQAR